MLDFSSMKKALFAINAITLKTEDPEIMNSLDPTLRMALIAGVIQHFEFTYELAWKYIKRWLEYNLGGTYVDGVSRRELFRLAAEHLLIDDVELWMDFHRARNLTSHTYNLETAVEIYELTLTFIEPANRLLQRLEANND